MLHGDDRIVTPDSPQNFNGFDAWVMYKHTLQKCGIANCFHIISIKFYYLMVITHWGSINAEKVLQESSSGSAHPVHACKNTYK